VGNRNVRSGARYSRATAEKIIENRAMELARGEPVPGVLAPVGAGRKVGVRQEPCRAPTTDSPSVRSRPHCGCRRVRSCSTSVQARHIGSRRSYGVMRHDVRRKRLAELDETAVGLRRGVVRAPEVVRGRDRDQVRRRTRRRGAKGAKPRAAAETRSVKGETEDRPAGRGRYSRYSEAIRLSEQGPSLV